MHLFLHTIYIICFFVIFTLFRQTIFINSKKKENDPTWSLEERLEEQKMNEQLDQLCMIETLATWFQFRIAFVCRLHSSDDCCHERNVSHSRTACVEESGRELAVQEWEGRPHDCGI